MSYGCAKILTEEKLEFVVFNPKEKEKQRKKKKENGGRASREEQ